MKQGLKKNGILLILYFITIPSWSQTSFNLSTEGNNYLGQKWSVQSCNLSKYCNLDGKFTEIFQEYFFSTTRMFNHSFQTNIDLNMISGRLSKSINAQVLSSVFIPLSFTPTLSFIEAETLFIFIFVTILVFSFGLILGGSLVYMFIRNKILKILGINKVDYSQKTSARKKPHRGPNFLSLVKRLKYERDAQKAIQDRKASAKQDSRKEVDKLNNKISELQKKNEELIRLNQRLTEKESVIDIKKDDTVEKVDTKIEEAELTKNLYYNIPEIEGNFKLENAKEFKEPDSFYKLELNDLSNGKVLFLSGEFDLRAIENLDYYLNPVCEIQNIGDRVSAKKVKMIQPGSFSLVGNLYEVKVKVKIKLV